MLFLDAFIHRYRSLLGGGGGGLTGRDGAIAPPPSLVRPGVGGEDGRVGDEGGRTGVWDGFVLIFYSFGRYFPDPLFGGKGLSGVGKIGITRPVFDDFCDRAFPATVFADAGFISAFHVPPAATFDFVDVDGLFVDFLFVAILSPSQSFCLSASMLTRAHSCSLQNRKACKAHALQAF